LTGCTTFSTSAASILVAPDRSCFAVFLHILCGSFLSTGTVEVVSCLLPINSLSSIFLCWLGPAPRLGLARSEGSTSVRLYLSLSGSASVRLHYSTRLLLFNQNKIIGALSRLSSISTLSIGPSSYSPSFHSLLFRLMESILIFMCSPLMTLLDLLLMELARGSKSQLRIALRWAFIPPLPPITCLVGGVPLLLSHNWWSLKSSHKGQASKLLLIMLSLHLFSCLQSFPTLNIFNIMLTVPFKIS
jgi:hypothetical protein